MKWLDIVINIFWGLLYSFITITFLMPKDETFCISESILIELYNKVNI